MGQHSFFDSDDEQDDDDWNPDDDEEVEDEDVYDGLFGLVMIDIPLIQRLIGCVRKVIARPDVSAQQIHELAKLLFGLEMLPAPMPKLYISLSVGKHYGNNESSYLELVLSDKEFRLESEAYIILDSSMGGDSMSSTAFQAEVGGYRSFDSPDDVITWLDNFEQACSDMGKEIDVTNYGENEIEWSAEPDPSLWDRLDFEGGWSLPFM